MRTRRSRDRLRFLRVDHRSLFARRQFIRLIFIVAGIWMVYTFLLSDQSLVSYFYLRHENGVLREQIRQAEASADSLQALADDLEKNRDAIERMARERYQMRGKEEMAYVFIPVDESEKGRYPPKEDRPDAARKEKGVDNGR
jgi:cell division protein FtsB